jgi:amino acid permease
MKRKKSKKLKGLTFVELIIAITVFSIIVVATVSAFATGVLGRRNTQKIQQNAEETRAAMELMAKNIRMSSLVIPDGVVQRIYMFNMSQDKCVSYRFRSDNLEAAEFPPVHRETDEFRGEDCSRVAKYTAEFKIFIEDASGRFDVTKTFKDPIGDEDPVVGKATIQLKKGSNNLQTTVSFRDYEDIIQ